MVFNVKKLRYVCVCVRFLFYVFFVNYVLSLCRTVLTFSIAVKYYFF